MTRLILVLVLWTISAVVSAAPPAKITVGTLTLKFCNSDYNGYCGTLQRPLDPTGQVKGSIDIGFEYYPRFDQNNPSIRSRPILD